MQLFFRDFEMYSSFKRKTQRKLRLTIQLIFLFIIGCTSLAEAHRGRGVNGGMLVESGSNHIEFVGASGYELLMIAISDKQQKPVSVSGVEAYISVERGGRKIRMPLQSLGDSILSSSTNPNLVAGETVWFIAQMPNGNILNAQFTSK